MMKKRKQCSDEFKVEAVAMVSAQGSTSPASYEIEVRTIA